MTLDDERRRAWSAVVDVYQHVVPRVVARLEDEAGVDSGVFSVLGHLVRADEPGRLPLSELHARMRARYSQPGLSRAVQRMEADGLVRRLPDPADGRAAIVVITQRGRNFHARAERVYRAALDEHFGRYVDEPDGLVAVLAPLARRMGSGDSAAAL